jgi:hypothetical protein
MALDTGAYSAILTWTAPTENDGDSVVRYDMRYLIGGLSDINWDYAVEIANEPTPGKGGTIESCLAVRLPSGTQLQFGIKSQNRAGNWSPLSNSAIIRTRGAASPHPPWAVRDLSVSAIANRTVTLTWTAPILSDSNGHLTAYDLRYMGRPIMNYSWDNAEIVSPMPVPGPPGSKETMIVTNLTPQTSYFFALKSCGDSLNEWSVLSNIAAVTTHDDSGTVSLIGQYDSPGYALQAVLYQHYCLLADHGGGLEILDINNPCAPNPVSILTADEPVRKVRVYGPGAYIITYQAGRSRLLLYNISTISAPVYVDQYTQAEQLQDVMVTSQGIYTVDYSRKFTMFDISGGNLNPYEYHTLPDLPLNIRAYDGHFLVADYGAGIIIINALDLWYRYEQTVYATQGRARAIFAYDSILYVAEDEKGVELISVSDINNSSKISQIDTPGQALDIAVSGNYAFVADGAPGGLQIINVKNKLDPYIVGYYPTPDIAQSVTYDGNFIYVAAGAAGLLVLQFTP